MNKFFAVIFILFTSGTAFADKPPTKCLDLLTKKNTALAGQATQTSQTSQTSGDPLDPTQPQVSWQDFNSVVLLKSMRDEKIFNCTAVAISRRLVLTAAHCLDSLAKNLVYVASPFDTTTQAPIAVTKATVHPDYNPAQSRYLNDLGVVELASDLPAGIKIYPRLSWDKKDQGPLTSDQIERVGLGTTDAALLGLRWTNPDFKELIQNQNVVAIHDEFAFPGDSGGPIFAKTATGYVIVAIHSTLDPNTNMTYSPFLPAYETWIDSVLSRK